jgi:hypothetical protein
MRSIRILFSLILVQAVFVVEAAGADPIYDRCLDIANGFQTNKYHRIRLSDDPKIAEACHSIQTDSAFHCLKALRQEEKASYTNNVNYVAFFNKRFRQYGPLTPSQVYSCSRQ